mmetsp:Transcript_87520/g.155239  ORF Transcript_87520/g.155239 Transcript_87520/m.155239 type:complete len:167 (+) Transcript_87520:75-575(+)|eukprot:CAMPEP_0197658108 /NCGR_PEP_ID=MMETSP1338-20131121/45036_1 /TAXON_ID=43686 ORGANISM="Pelagodinium beii, Strain RCC1491" /NCGR_SAMPLE_ID=MMETSP1338 /ASSEMBLY_ACC=CAM_ASM_000754 /LENGTH=166 /DNA_ID=CAMNT_0043234621 /DNA_START=75 /DNA_END=575 /DNA_ORIENTATION=+
MRSAAALAIVIATRTLLTGALKVPADQTIVPQEPIQGPIAEDGRRHLNQSVDFLRNELGEIEHFSSCSEACNECYKDYYQTCLAKCRRGCEDVCEERLEESSCKKDGKSSDEIWVAQIGTIFDVDTKGFICQVGSTETCPGRQSRQRLPPEVASPMSADEKQKMQF